MPGSLSFSGPDPSLGGQASQIGVFLFDPDEGYTALPNVNCIQVNNAEGSDPPAARFRYIMESAYPDSPFPSQFEQLWPLNLPDPSLVGEYIVVPDDRLVVMALMPDGSTDLLFDGFARMPQVDVNDNDQAVTFSAVGVEFRCWDVPIKGRVQRDGDPTGMVVKDGTRDRLTNLPTRFNPADSRNPTGQPNCTPDDYDTGEDDPSTGYPVFVDENLDIPGVAPEGQDFPPPPKLWTLSGALQFILSVYNPPDDSDESWLQADVANLIGFPLDPDEGDPGYIQFVKNPDFTDLSGLLDSRRPKEGSDFFDPNDPETYDSDPIEIRDFDATNMCWPEAVERLLGYYGFGMRWVLGQDDDGFPTHTFEVYRKDNAAADEPKVLFMQATGATLDPSLSNVESLSASFDYHGVANEYIIETHPNRWEVSVVLAPLFEPKAGDEDRNTRTKFDKANLDASDDATRKAYRWYGADECGYGHWDFGQSKTVYTPFDFSEVWPDIQDSGAGESTKAYVARNRPGRRDCIADDGTGDVSKAQLALSRDYAGKSPAIFDGTGTWQPITGDWALLEDRLGIEFTADNPEAIHAGEWKKHGTDTIQNSGPILKGIKSIANPGDNAKGDKRFYLRLTTVIDADQGIEAVAKRRPASPLKNVVQRRINAKDHFRKDTIHVSSAFFSEEQAANPNLQPNDDGNLVPRDDTQAATDHANQLRYAHEFPAVPMTVQIPGVCLAYDVGDRISLIAGRDVSLLTNAGSSAGEGSSFPFIVARSFDFSGDAQRTVLQLSDRRLEPQGLEHRRGR